MTPSSQTEVCSGAGTATVWQKKWSLDGKLSVREAWGGGSNQVAFDSKACGSRPRADPELVVNGSEMRVDRAQANDKVFCHLGIGQACCHQPQDLHFAGRQSGRIGRRGLDLASSLWRKHFVYRKRLGRRHGASFRQGF